MFTLKDGLSDNLSALIVRFILFYGHTSFVINDHRGLGNRSEGAPSVGGPEFNSRLGQVIYVSGQGVFVNVS